MMRKFVGRAVTNLRRGSKQYDLTWRYTFNLAPTLAYKLRTHRLGEEAGRVVEDLNRRGMAITSVKALLGTTTAYDELVESVRRLEASLATLLSESRLAAGNDTEVGKKSYTVMLLNKLPPGSEPDGIFRRFALQQQIREIANAYFGMYPKLSHYDIWHTFPTRAAARESQLWHRDPEDRCILKMFMNLSDVDDGAGPFTYAPGTHSKVRLPREPEYFTEENGGKRSHDAQMAAVIPSSHWVTGIGPAGTIVFADTHGYHKGGLARERDRLLYTCMFTSQAAR
jgi:hypothetical protein